MCLQPEVVKSARMRPVIGQVACQSAVSQSEERHKRQAKTACSVCSPRERQKRGDGYTHGSSFFNFKLLIYHPRGPIPQIQSQKVLKYGAFIKITHGILTCHKKICFSLPLHSNKLNLVSAGEIRHEDFFNDIQLYFPSMPSPPSLNFSHPTITVVLSLFLAKL